MWEYYSPPKSIFSETKHNELGVSFIVPKVHIMEGSFSIKEKRRSDSGMKVIPQDKHPIGSTLGMTPTANNEWLGKSPVPTSVIVEGFISERKILRRGILGELGP